MRRRVAWLLLAGDTLCLAVFVFLGLGSHAELGSRTAAYRFLVNAGPLIVVWALAAYALGALRWQPPLPLRAVLARTLTAWLVAAPLALVVRALVLGSPTLAVTFVLVTLALGGALLLAWRTAFALIVNRRA